MPLPSKDVLRGYCELMAPTVGPMVITLRGTVRLACVCVCVCVSKWVGK